MNFSVEEENLICMYHTSDRRRTMARMLTALPDMDTEMRRLANGTIAKLEHMTDADFDGQRFDFTGEQYRQLNNGTLFSVKVMCHCQHRNSRTRWPCGCCVRLFSCISLYLFSRWDFLAVRRHLLQCRSQAAGSQTHSFL